MPPTIAKSPDDSHGYRLLDEITLPNPLAAVFEFFADAANLQMITPPWLDFSIQTPAPIEMKSGTLIDYRLRIHHCPVRWRTRIAVWEPPLRFVDEQVRGPYRYWRHEHTFEEQDGKTIVRDRVDYSLRGGELVHRLFVRSDLRRIFEYRGETLAAIFSEYS